MCKQQKNTILVDYWCLFDHPVIENMSEKNRDAERMNREGGADAWGSQRPETPPWDAAEYSQLISAGPLLPLLEQYAGVGMMRDNKRREQFPSSQRWRWHSTYVVHSHFFAGSYDQNTLRGPPSQVQSQGANTDKCTGSQLQLASMANQGNAKRKKSTCCCGREKWTCKKLAKGLTSYHGWKCRAFIQRVASGSTNVPAIDVIHRWVHKKSEVADAQLAEGV